MNFADLTKKVVEVALGGARMIDIATGSYSVLSDGENVFLVSEKKERVPVTLAGLASLRIVEDAAKAQAVKTTRDARESIDYTNLQKALLAEKVKLSESTKFNVVHRLQIIDVATDQPIYKNDCYKGYPEYMKASRNAANLPKASEEQIAVRNAAFTDASDALRKSGLKSGITADSKNLQQMPVFTVTA